MSILLPTFFKQKNIKLQKMQGLVKRPDNLTYIKQKLLVLKMHVTFLGKLPRFI